MSISSLEGLTPPTDLAAKYQKLAAEYAKMRAQVTVLKQAVRDEQNKYNVLKDDIKIRDQELRKNSQELESLLFRNQQLTKRVSVLQEELENVPSPAKKNTPRPEHSNRTSEEAKLFQEELQNRILQNASLLTQLEEKCLELELTKNQSNETIRKLEIQVQSGGSDCPTCKSAVSNAPAQNHTPKQKRPKAVRSLSSLLPRLSDLIKNINNVFLAYDTHTCDLLQLAEALSSSHEPALRKYLINLTILCKRTNRDPVIELLLPLTKDLLSQVIDLSDSDTDNSQSFATIGETLRCFENAASQSLESRCAVGAENSWKTLRETCVSIQAALNDPQQRATAMQKSQSPPKYSQEYYENKICALEKQLSKLSCNHITTSEDQAMGSASIPFDGVAGDVKSLPIEAVRDLLINKSNSVLEYVQIAESKITRVQCECDALQSRLEHTIEELGLKKERVTVLEDELSVTTRNYEVQLGSLSEHMANMNDKLTAQETTIEELKGVINDQDKRRRGK